VQKIVRTETRMQGVGDAQASGVLPPIENAAGVHNATVVFKSRTACRRRNTATSRAKDLVHRPHTCEAVRKRRWHLASRLRTMSLPSSAWAFTQP